jgi:NAD(P)-dependent dehydrogenase (short-subunit alcohol dehydrogenase family)
MTTPSRTIIITGAGQGIGRATAHACVKAGMNVIIAEIDEEAGREAEQELVASGRAAACIRTDVADEASVASMVAATVSRFGAVHALVNNAAISAGKPVSALTLDEWDRVIGVNLTGPFLCAKHCAPHLRKARGSIVNIASTRALMSEADTEAYSASKGGIVALTHALSVSLGPEVRVNCICPGWIETRDWRKQSKREAPVHSDRDRLQHPAGRVGVPDDIANMVLFLLSPENGFITGQNFVVDGGMTKKMVYA